MGQPSLVSALVASKHSNLHQRSIDGKNEELLEELKKELGNDDLSWDMIRRHTNKEGEEWDGNEDELVQLFQKLDTSLVEIKKGNTRVLNEGSDNNPTVVRAETGEFSVSNNPKPDPREETRLRVIFLELKWLGWGQGTEGQ